MALEWDDGDSLEKFLSDNKKSIHNLGTLKITNDHGKVTVCEMVRRTLDTMVLYGIDESNPDLFNNLKDRLSYIYVCAKKMQNRIQQLNGSSDDLFEKIDPDYDLNNRINRIKKLK